MNILICLKIVWYKNIFHPKYWMVNEIQFYVKTSLHTRYMNKVNWSPYSPPQNCRRLNWEFIFQVKKWLTSILRNLAYSIKNICCTAGYKYPSFLLGDVFSEIEHWKSTNVQWWDNFYWFVHLFPSTITRSPFFSAWLAVLTLKINYLRKGILWKWREFI